MTKPFTFRSKSMTLSSTLLLAGALLYAEVISTTSTPDLPPLPLVPYPQHVTLSSAAPAVINPLEFTFSTQAKSSLLQEVIKGVRVVFLMSWFFLMLRSYMLSKF